MTEAIELPEPDISARGVYGYSHTATLQYAAACAAAARKQALEEAAQVCNSNAAQCGAGEAIYACTECADDIRQLG